MRARPSFSLFWCLGGVLFLGGCTYHAGFPIDRYGIKTIYVKPAVKEALTAQISGILTTQIREEILRNGFLRLADKDHADATLETTITDYNRGISVTDEDDDEKAKSLSLSATVKYTLKDNRTGKTISDGSASGSVGINATTNAQAIEYQRTPQLTRSLAKQIANCILLKEKPKEEEKKGIEEDSEEDENEEKEGIEEASSDEIEAFPSSSHKDDSNPQISSQKEVLEQQDTSSSRADSPITDATSCPTQETPSPAVSSTQTPPANSTTETKTNAVSSTDAPNQPTEPSVEKSSPNTPATTETSQAQPLIKKPESVYTTPYGPYEDLEKSLN